MTERQASRRFPWGVLIASGIALVILLALGTWQVQRLVWKRDLIARVEARIHADPVPAPSRAAWDGVDARKDEYRRVSATGLFRHEQSVLVQAVTERGAGFWVLTPMTLADETTVGGHRDRDRVTGLRRDAGG